MDWDFLILSWVYVACRFAESEQPETDINYVQNSFLIKRTFVCIFKGVFHPNIEISTLKNKLGGMNDGQIATASPIQLLG
ncbi:hypothetical protein [Fictibacillus sp. 18YEL24]|uniref:hypothetical protein n=1 Tax=Fictibacillus sp. 18YEL24 TaxID=2745875 RepID=UPI0018CFBD18|nr:hypothetical protein [Fictibacillus sp. 18YEL24]MBH0169542.1 hypothetical protein [Fictibacillus sp. 18YEL24]